MSESIDDLVEFINEQIAYQVSQSNRKHNKSPHAKAKHQQSANNFIKVKGVLLNHKENSSSPRPFIESNTEEDDLFSIKASEVDNLPDSIKDVLKLNASEILDSQILELLEIAGRPLNLKELIIGLYRKFDYVVPERNPFASKLYRMLSQEQIKSFKKGYYVLPDYTEAESELTQLEKEIEGLDQEYIQQSII